MIAIAWIIFAACVTNEAMAYNISLEITDVKCQIPGLVVTKDDPNEGDIKVTSSMTRNITFKADFMEGGYALRRSIRGDVCGEIDEETPDGFIAGMIRKTVGIEDCPLEASEYNFVTKMDSNTTALEDVMPPGFGYAVIYINIFRIDMDPDVDVADAIWTITMIENAETE